MLRTAIIGLAAAAAISAGPVAAAAPRAKTSTYDACLKRSAGTTFAMRDCMSAEYERQDKALNELYRNLLAHIAEPQRKAALQSAERAWLAYRKSECDFAASAEAGGTLAPVIADDCFVQMTAERVKALRAYVTAEAEH